MSDSRALSTRVAVLLFVLGLMTVLAVGLLTYAFVTTTAPGVL